MQYVNKIINKKKVYIYTGLTIEPTQEIPRSGFNQLGKIHTTDFNTVIKMTTLTD